MHFARSLILSIASAGLILTMMAGAARGQTSKAPDASAPGRTASFWTVEAGHESFWLRPVSQIARPMDASFVKWAGGGPTLLVSREWERPAGARRVAFAVSALGRFAYDTGVQSIARPAQEGSSWVSGHYEQPHFLFRNWLPAGLDAGFGFQALGERLSFDRRYSPDIAERETDLCGGVAFVLLARYHGWHRLGVEAEWANGALAGHTSWVREADALGAGSGWAGGWLTDLAVRGDVPVAHRTAVTFRYGRAEHFFAWTHHAQLASRRQFTIGVMYGR